MIHTVMHSPIPTVNCLGMCDQCVGFFYIKPPRLHSSAEYFDVPHHPFLQLPHHHSRDHVNDYHNGIAHDRRN